MDSMLEVLTREMPRVDYADWSWNEFPLGLGADASEVVLELPLQAGSEGNGGHHVVIEGTRSDYVAQSLVERAVAGGWLVTVVSDKLGSWGEYAGVRNVTLAVDGGEDSWRAMIEERACVMRRLELMAAADVRYFRDLPDPADRVPRMLVLENLGVLLPDEATNHDDSVKFSRAAAADTLGNILMLGRMTGVHVVAADWWAGHPLNTAYFNAHISSGPTTVGDAIVDVYGVEPPEMLFLARGVCMLRGEDAEPAIFRSRFIADKAEEFH